MWEKTGRPSPQSPKGILGLPSPYGRIHTHAKRQNQFAANSRVVGRAAGKKTMHRQNLPTVALRVACEVLGRALWKILAAIPRPRTAS